MFFCQIVAQLPVSLRDGVLQLEVGIIAGLPVYLYVEHMAVAHLALSKIVHLAYALFWQVGRIVHIGYESLDALGQFAEGDAFSVTCFLRIS